MYSVLRQLLPWALALAATLMVVHHTPGLIPLLAGQATNTGCHQSNDIPTTPLAY